MLFKVFAWWNDHVRRKIGPQMVLQLMTSIAESTRSSGGMDACEYPVKWSHFDATHLFEVA